MKRVLFAAIAAYLAATAGYSSGTAKCEDAFAIADNLNPIMDAMNGILDWCSSGRLDQPACQELTRLVTVHDVPAHSAAAMDAFLSVGMQCLTSAKD